MAFCSFSAQAAFGTFAKPFKADSPWNIRPINPVLGTYTLPLTGPQNWDPKISTGDLSTAAFLAKDSDSAMEVFPLEDEVGVWDPDAAVFLASITIPRWPQNVVPAEGGDGHADIVDPVTGKVHSFWKLRYINGKWRAKQHAWSSLTGRGWGDPAHYYQGARAVGVPTIGGLIRIHEVDDGESHYKHALAMSASWEGLSGNPTFIYPATSADAYSNTKHIGQVPEGALMMLPQDYNMQISNPQLQKVVETLKIFGARVVDENYGTPFHIYVENGAAFNLYGEDSEENNSIRGELRRMREAMRQVISADYVDGDGNPTTADEPGNFNLLSLRGPWKPTQVGGPVGVFNSLTQSIEFASVPTAIRQQNGDSTGISGGKVPGDTTRQTRVTWAKPVSGATYRLTASGTGSTSVMLHLYSGGTAQAQTPELKPGESSTFVWPNDGWATVIVKNVANKAGSISATMIRVD